MNLEFFKQRNELDGLNINVMKEKIKKQLLKNKEYEDFFNRKKQQYMYGQFTNMKTFLVEELNFKLTRENNTRETYDMLFEFIKEGNEYSIEVSNKNNNKGICLIYKFKNKVKQELILNMDLADEKYGLQIIDMWELEEKNWVNDYNQKDYEAKYTNIPTESVNWYLNEYKNIKQIVEKNNKIYIMIKNVNSLFEVVAISNDGKYKEYINIVDLIKDIIKAEE